MEKLISVIVPVYNAQTYLPHCVDSILRQSYQKLEIILIDDGSTDMSYAMCDEYAAMDRRVKVIHKENGGVTSARKAGLAEAAGEYIGFVDSDDWIEPHMYETLYKLFEENDLDIISCGFYREGGEETEIRSDGLKEGMHVILDHDAFMQEVMKGNKLYSENICSYLWSKLIRKEILINCQKRICDRITYIEDRALLYTCYYETRRLFILKKPLYHYRIRKDSLVNAADEYLISKLNDVFVYLKHLFLSHDASLELLKLNDRFLVGHLWGILNCNMGLYGKFITYLLPERAKGKKLVIYGAGTVGKEYVSQLAVNGCTGWWTDTNWNKLDDSRIISPEEALNKDYDYIIIAVKKEDMADEIMKQLNGCGVSKTKILWEIRMGGAWVYV